MASCVIYTNITLVFFFINYSFCFVYLLLSLQLNNFSRSFCAWNCEEGEGKRAAREKSAKQNWLVGHELAEKATVELDVVISMDQQATVRGCGSQSDSRKGN